MEYRYTVKANVIFNATSLYRNECYVVYKGMNEAEAAETANDVRVALTDAMSNPKNHPICYLTADMQIGLKSTAIIGYEIKTVKKKIKAKKDDPLLEDLDTDDDESGIEEDSEE